MYGNVLHYWTPVAALLENSLDAILAGLAWDSHGCLQKGALWGEHDRLHPVCLEEYL
jgi:hypothetical protein